MLAHFTVLQNVRGAVIEGVGRWYPVCTLVTLHHLVPTYVPLTLDDAFQGFCMHCEFSSVLLAHLGAALLWSQVIIVCTRYSRRADPSGRAV